MDPHDDLERAGIDLARAVGQTPAVASVLLAIELARLDRLRHLRCCGPIGRPVQLTDEVLVQVVADTARAAQRGVPVPESIVSMLKAIASTRDEQRRHELARQAEARAGQLGEVALQVLRVAIFALG